MQTALKGTWNLVEAVAIDRSGNITGYPLGRSPQGIVQVGAERLLGVLCGDPTGVDSQRQFLAYSGPYTFDGRILVTVTDSASSPDMLVEQRREVVFESPKRMAVIPLNAILGSSTGGGMRLT